MIEDTKTQQAEEVNEDELTPEEATGALVKLETVNIGELLATGKGVEEILAEVRRHTADIVPDLTTEKGRKAVRSLAYRVSRTKALLDEKRLEHTKDLRDRIALLNSNGKTLIDGLAKIRDDVKAPLEAWEAEEEARQQALIEEARLEAEAREAAERFAIEVQQRIDTWRNAPAIVVGMTVAEVEATLERYEQMQLNPESFGDRVEEATAVRQASLDKIAGYLALQRKAEELEQQAAEAAAAKQREIDEAAAAARAEEQAKADLNLRINDALDEMRATYAATELTPSEQIRRLLDANARHELDEELFGDRLRDGLRTLREIRAELEAVLHLSEAREQREREAEERRQREAEAARRRQQRDEIMGRIQGIQTKPLIEAAACGSAEALQALRDRTAAAELDRADFDHVEDPHGDLWNKALESRATALAKLDEMIAAKQQADADAHEAARLRQEAAARAEREERERQAEARRAAQAANEAHRNAIRREAIDALMSLAGWHNAGLTPEASSQLASTLVAAIEAGEIPHVEITL